MCDLPIIAFIKIISALALSKKLEKYAKNDQLNKRMPNFTVRMGFGLNLGWGIEV